MTTVIRPPEPTWHVRERELREQLAIVMADLSALRAAAAPFAAWAEQLDSGRDAGTHDAVRLMTDHRGGEPGDGRVTVGDLRAVRDVVRGQS